MEKLLFAFLIFSLFSIAVGVVRGESSIDLFFKLQESRKFMERRVQEISAENERIQHEIDAIQNSASYARKVLRDKYHLIEENERIVFFAD